MLAVAVRKEKAESVKNLLLAANNLDKNRRIMTDKSEVVIPIKRKPSQQELTVFKRYGITILTQSDPSFRDRSKVPFENIITDINLPDDLERHLPKKWELLGDVLILKLPEILERFKLEIAELYARELRARTVLMDKGIEGIYRSPQMEILYGAETETIHKENGVKFKLDTARLMFSSGNIDERVRMASIADREETVVDMFASIGIFSIPMAVHSKPESILACEINPFAYNYLCENIELNEVDDIVEPILGDNREVAPEGVADRVIMGYITNTHEYLPKAFKVLKYEGGIIHYHETCPNELLPNRPLDRVKDAAKGVNRDVKLLNLKEIKSYAPGVSHVVLDVKVN